MIYETFQQTMSQYEVVNQYPILMNSCLQSFFVLLLFWIFSKIFIFITSKYIARLCKNTDTDIDDLILDAAKKPLHFIILVLGLTVALVPLSLNSIAYEIFFKFLISVAIILVTYFLVVVSTILIAALGKSLAKKTDSTLDDQLLPIINKVMDVILWVVGLVIVMKVWSVNISGVLAGLGIAGVAIGFALKDSLGNIFGGISLILDKAIQVGDLIKLESGDSGYVVDIGLRTTRIRNFDNELIIVPNGYLSNSRIQNYVLPDHSVRAAVNFGVEYGSDVEKVKKIVLGALKKVDNLSVEKEPGVFFMEMGDSSLNFTARFWVDDFTQRFASKEQATTHIYNALNKAKIGIPFPTRTIYMEKG